jgi:hypothetical protein
LGEGIDEAIGELLVEALNPLAIEVRLAVQRELQSRIEEADCVRHKQVDITVIVFRRPSSVVQCAGIFGFSSAFVTLKSCCSSAG